MDLCRWHAIVQIRRKPAHERGQGNIFHRDMMAAKNHYAELLLVLWMIVSKYDLYVCKGKKDKISLENLRAFLRNKQKSFHS